MTTLLTLFAIGYVDNKNRLGRRKSLFRVNNREHLNTLP